MRFVEFAQRRTILYLCINFFPCMLMFRCFSL